MLHNRFSICLKYVKKVPSSPGLFLLYPHLNKGEDGAGLSFVCGSRGVGTHGLLPDNFINYFNKV